LTAQTGLKCEACHSDTAQLSAPPQTTPAKVENTPVSAVQTPAIENTSKSQETPGFDAIPAIGLMMAGYLIRRRRLN
jgi:hypothetical protein